MIRDDLQPMAAVAALWRRQTSYLKITLGVVLAIHLSAQPKASLPARRYYSELKEAGGLDRYKDMFVCFAEDDQTTIFTVIAKVSDVISEMKKNGIQPNKEFLQAGKALLIENFDKGVSRGTDIYDPMGEQGDAWKQDFRSPFPGRVVMSVNWAGSVAKSGFADNEGCQTGSKAVIFLLISSCCACVGT